MLWLLHFRRLCSLRVRVRVALEILRPRNLTCLTLVPALGPRVFRAVYLLLSEAAGIDITLIPGLSLRFLPCSFPLLGIMLGLCYSFSGCFLSLLGWSCKKQWRFLKCSQYIYSFWNSHLPPTLCDVAAYFPSPQLPSLQLSSDNEGCQGDPDFLITEVIVRQSKWGMSPGCYKAFLLNGNSAWISTTLVQSMQTFSKVCGVTFLLTWKFIFKSKISLLRHRDSTPWLWFTIVIS